jgi:hypothetical protein
LPDDGIAGKIKRHEHRTNGFRSFGLTAASIIKVAVTMASQKLSGTCEVSSVAYESKLVERLQHSHSPDQTFSVSRC